MPSTFPILGLTSTHPHLFVISTVNFWEGACSAFYGKQPILTPFVWFLPCTAFFARRKECLKPLFFASNSGKICGFLVLMTKVTKLWLRDGTFILVLKHPERVERRLILLLGKSCTAKTGGIQVCKVNQPLKPLTCCNCECQKSMKKKHSAGSKY